jgi:glycosyltransferase involved in cell wall biosynthesis
MEYPKISIVTPSFNKGSFIEKTIQSVLGQDYPNLEYIIIDGGSTDNSIDIIQKYQTSLKYWITEKDDGMYHAIQKGFGHSTGEIMGWLNSDDILHPKSLFTIAEMFSSFEEVEWIQGHPTVVDETGRIVYSRNARNNKFDFYKKKYRDGVFIQQESTYWRQSLWEKAGSHISTDYKYAGDFELWMRFFNYAKLYNTSAIIGAFRFSGEGQITNNHYDAYLNECDLIIDKTILNLDKVVLKQVRKNKLWNLFSKDRDEAFIEDERIEYNFSTKKFYLSGTK